MNYKPKNFDVSLVTEFFEYEPETGIISWAKKPCSNSTILPGDIAGTLHPSGYVFITLKRRRYLAHRIAWAIHYGNVPLIPVDHINGDKKDNRIDNLRLVNYSENIQNQKRPQSRNTTGFLGVSRFRNGKYRATINVGGKNMHLGTFQTPDDASRAYVEAKSKYHIELERLGLKEAACN